ncbi:MAG TPA: MMPL family transporter [Solirubrobacterales bacterium]|nr:MMPL family transporter [Solirubrobacterales bacterium]
MTRLARFCFNHRGKVVSAWLVALVVVLVAGHAVGGEFNSDFNLPGTDSQAAVSLLTAGFPSASGEGDQIVVQAEGGAGVRSPAVRKAFGEALTRVAKVPGVEAVGSPYAKGGAAQISRDGKVAFATVNWKMVPSEVTESDGKELIEAAQSGDGAALHISLEGQSISKAESASPGLSVLVGVIAAFLILMVVFGGALMPSLMPLITAGLALLIGTSVIDLLTHTMDVASVSTDLAVLIGLGVGVDYGLFIISRHRSAIKNGASYEDAAAEAVNTSGRTVLFAGLTVCIALLGQFALGVNYLYGLSLSSAVAVALTMATSLTFLPAMLGFLGPKVLSRRERAALAAGTLVTSDSSPFWHRWAKFVERRHARVAAASLLVIALLAAPILGLRLGSSDAATEPASNTTHQAYDALSEGFGPGSNGPLELAAHTPTAAASGAFSRFLGTVSGASGVAAVTAPMASPDGKVAVATLFPSTSPQAQATVSLVERLRDELIPRAARGTGLVVHVGGETATDIDFSNVLSEKLPIFIAVVVLLAFVLLMAVFRSLLIPLVASIMNLLSIGAGLGALNAVFNWGWGSSLLGLTGTSPIDAFIPVLMFSVLFGLSTDYEIYLVSRIQEEWRRADGDNGRAIVDGQAKSGRIIAGAAMIMVLVFGSFLLSGERLLQEFGFGLAFAVLADALIIRGLLVPSIMHLIGPANWYLPRWLDRVLPNLSIEAGERAPRPSSAAPQGEPVVVSSGDAR